MLCRSCFFVGFSPLWLLLFLDFIGSHDRPLLGNFDERLICDFDGSTVCDFARLRVLRLQLVLVLHGDFYEMVVRGFDDSAVGGFARSRVLRRQLMLAGFAGMSGASGGDVAASVVRQ